MASTVTTSIILYKSQKKKNNKYPAKLRITFNRKQRYFNINNKHKVYEFTDDEFKKITSTKPRGIYKEISLEFSLIENKAKSIIEKMDEFSFGEFKNQFGIPGRDLTNILFYLEQREIELENAGKVSNAGQYSAAIGNLKEFFNHSRQIDFREITFKKLREYEQWILNKGNTMSSVRSNIIPLRTMFNEAIDIKAISKDMYPFGRKGYKIPAPVNKKRSLNIKEIAKIFNYKCEPFSKKDEAKDFWILSYLMNGANMTDIAHLKWKNIDNEFIKFVRRKTQNTSKEQKVITVVITDEIKAILKKWGSQNHSSDNLVFNIIEEGMTEKQKRIRLVAFLHKINSNMRNIAREIGINKQITSYYARHSFSTILMRSGVSTQFISESLGHAELKTTQLYLDSFEDDTRKEYAKHLTAFKLSS